MKILFVTNRYLPEEEAGNSKLVKTIASAVKDKGFEVTVLAYSDLSIMRDQEKIKEVYIRHYVYEGINVTTIQSAKLYLGHNLHDENIKAASKEILEIIQPDIIHFCHLYGMSEICFAAIEMKIPYIITAIDGFLFCYKASMIRDFEYCEYTDKGNICEKNCSDNIINFAERYKDTKTFIENAVALTSPSIFLANRIKKEFENVKISVMNHGLQADELIKNERIYKNSDILTFGITGKLSILKGAHILIMAFDALKDIKNIKLKVFGKGGSEDLIALILNDDRIELCGAFEPKDIENVYKQIDVAVCPSLYYESYSYAVNEPLQRNIPVIASNCGAIPESIQNLKNSILFERGNVEELSNAIRLLAENPELLNYFKKNIDVSHKTTARERDFYIDKYNSISNKSSNTETTAAFEIDDIYKHWSYMKDKFLKDHGVNVDLGYYDKIIKSLNDIHLVNSEDLIISYFKLCYLSQKNKNSEVKYAIWGASVSGVTMKKLADLFCPNLKLVCFFDKFKTSETQNTETKPVTSVEHTLFDVLFICTQAGKPEAVDKMNEMGLKLAKNYFYGYKI